MTEFLLLAFVVLLFVVGRLYLLLNDLQSHVTELRKRLRQVEAELLRQPAPKSPASSPEKEAPIPPAHPLTPGIVPPPLPSTTPVVRTPPAPVLPPLMERRPLPAESAIPPLPSFRDADAPGAQPKEKEKSLLPELTLEAFMGVKLFAWVGGLALFLGIVFFVKYSFERNLITPQMRVAIGAITGLGLIVGGLRMPRPKFAVTAQTLCATGIVTLYGVTFGAYAFYHFLGMVPAFVIMAAITTAAFLLAIRLNAQVVAVLGLLGGFLTPLLLSTGQDNPVGLFTYLAALDVGLIAVALRQRWRYLVTLGAVATALMQLAWVAAYFAPAKVGTGAVIFLGFEALFLLPFWLCNREADGEVWTTAASGVSAGTALAFAGHLLTFADLGQRPWICLSILLAADAGLVAWPLRNKARQGGPFFGGAAAFLILSLWNVLYLNDALLNWALGFFLVFAAFHTALPLVLHRLRPSATTPKWVQVFPALGLILMLWPALHIGASTSLWIAVLVADLAAIALAALARALLGLVAALVLTLIATGLWLIQTPVENPQLSGLLTVIAGFAALFCGASVFLQKRIRATGPESPSTSFENEALDHLPAISAAVPFALLISAVLRLHPENPSSIFSVGMLLVVVILGLARWSQTVALPPVALICATLLQYCWHMQMVPRQHGWLPLAWCLGFTAVIFAFPFLFQSRKAAQSTPWATAALAPVLHYPLIHGVIRNTWPEFWHAAGGLVPAALAIPPLAACDYLRRRLLPENTARLTVLAWFGGVALLFITLIFPVQFRQEWLTLSWALEGAALLWLFHRLPHPGLRKVGFALLCIAFARLAVNPAVLAYHARSGLPIWNWYLYTYGLGAGCFFLAGWLTAPPRDRLGELPLPPTLFSLGTILLFLLLNIEIADYFSTGTVLTFDFEGNLARDMTYSIAWSLFALVLLLIGMHRRVAGVRYAGIGLLAITLVKLFFHDLASLDQLYRIGALIIVAIVLIGASYLYQRFLAVDEEKPPQA
ncbi:MAG: DUF2339 domain-containing protein [Chthoniobacter sp.]|uniref:DUF2339 domain-containing protein n=1 Tax=Chthoniobacter sp. TaxID=2510640 RepID=UPI0032A1617A